jgi:hypothetical protein
VLRSSSRGYFAGYFAGAEEEERVQRCIDTAKVQRFRGSEVLSRFWGSAAKRW